MLNIKFKSKILENADGKVYEVTTYEKRREVSTEKVDEEIASLEDKIVALGQVKAEITAVK